MKDLTSKEIYNNKVKYVCLYINPNSWETKYIIREVVENADYNSKLYQYMKWDDDGTGSGHIVQIESIIHIEIKQKDSLERIKKDYSEYLI